MYFPLPFRGVDVKSSMFEIGDTDLKPVYSVDSPLYSGQLPSYRIAIGKYYLIKTRHLRVAKLQPLQPVKCHLFFPKPDLLNVPNFTQPDSR